MKRFFILSLFLIGLIWAILTQIPLPRLEGFSQEVSATEPYVKIRLAQKIWLYDYFPWLWEDALRFLPLNELASLIQANTQRSIEAFPLMLPYDLSDLFAAAAWRRPELYLQPEVRAGISSFALADPNVIESGVKSLAADLSSGEWDAKYGEIRSLTEIDVGYRFLRVSVSS